MTTQPAFYHLPAWETLWPRPPDLYCCCLGRGFAQDLQSWGNVRVGTQVLCSGLLWSPHLTDEEAEAQRGEGTEQDAQPGLLDARL